MTERALSFGSVARAYERFRPGYPEELVDDVLSYAGRPVRSALEIGAGTGKATRVFAGRGIVVTATEPDAGMLAELCLHVPATVVPVEAAFEDVVATSPYDLVFAAASLHWTTPAGRWERIARLLGPGGVFASFGGQLCLADPALEAAVHVAQAPDLSDDGFPSPDGTPPDAPMRWPGTELVASSLFTDVRQSVIERRSSMSADDYVGHLSTISAYLVLPGPVRDDVFARIRRVLPPQVVLRGDVFVHLARMVA